MERSHTSAMRDSAGAASDQTAFTKQAPTDPTPAGSVPVSHAGKSGVAVSVEPVDGSTATDTELAGRGEGFGAAIISLLAAGAESAIIYGRFIYDLPYIWLAAGHIVVLAILCGWIYSITRRGGDTSLALLTTLAIAAMGPIGGLVGAMAGIATPARAETTPLLKEWYERISHSVWVDPVTKHCDMVAIGRALDLAGAAPPSFSVAINKGTLLQKQNALGMIARKFHPSYLPALKVALKSDEPVIRVQAAAVAAHVRDDVKELLHQNLDDMRACQSDISDATSSETVARNTRIALRLIEQTEQCLASGLLDEKDRTSGRQLVRDLSAQILDKMEAASSAGLDINGVLESDLTSETLLTPDKSSTDFEAIGGFDVEAVNQIYARQLDFDRMRDSVDLKLTYERLLLRSGRFDLFRARRYMRPGLVSGLWRVRRLREAHS